MRSVCLALWLLVAALAPPPAGGPDIVARLISDLLPLKLAVASEEPLKDDVYSPAELQSVETYSQSQAIRPFEKHLMEFRFRRYLNDHDKPRKFPVSLQPFIGPDQAYKLAYVLTGKDLSEASLKPLVQALLSMLESAEVCRDEGSPLGNSAEFRTAAENARNSLQALGVSRHDVRVVMDSLFRGAIAATSPPPKFTYE